MMPSKNEKKTMKVRIVYALEGFSADVNIINLSKDISIRKIPESKRREFYDRVKGLPTVYNLDELLKSEYFLFFHTHVTFTPTGIIDPLMFEEPARKGLELLKLHFRLFREEDIGIRFYSNYTYSNKTKKYESTGISMNYLSPWTLNGKYHVTIKDLPGFRKRFQALSSFDLEQNKALKIALKRFNFSYYRYDWEDQIIDLMISFEALFVSEQGEITYRLALRASKFIGKKNNTIEIFDFLKNCYAMRSKIVHGDDPTKSNNRKNDKWDGPSAVIKLRDLLRQALVKCINEYDQESIKNLIPDIDLKLFS